MKLIDAQDRTLGDVERVVKGSIENETYVGVGAGGVLGLFQRHVALPLASLDLKGDGLVTSQTAAELKRMPTWDQERTQELTEHETAKVKVIQ